MEGKVKITVIATGFDRMRAAASPAAQAIRSTPVDLSAYAGQKEEEEPRVALGGGRVLLTRRPVLDLSSMPLKPVVQAAPQADDPLGYDVPAFLRRQEG
jgi:hypothetical protein